MDKKIKNYIIYAVFIVLLFLSTLFKSFSTDVLWPKDQNAKGSFDGIIFSDPQDISGLNVTRTIFKENNKDLWQWRRETRWENRRKRKLHFPIGICGV